jgi:hypothetical protein
MNEAPYQIRMLDEQANLNDRIVKLDAFVKGDMFQQLDKIDRDLLVEQRAYMGHYADVLRRRIERFKQE